jgi:methylmalonyl-CoA mutase
MTDLSEAKKLAEYRATNKVRFVTAASLFDGHDASINIMRRILQADGRRGHPPRATTARCRRSSTPRCRRTRTASPSRSYQGGHMEYFSYMIERLRAAGGPTSGCSAAAGAPSPTRSRELPPMA